MSSFRRGKQKGISKRFVAGRKRRGCGDDALAFAFRADHLEARLLMCVGDGLDPALGSYPALMGPMVGSLSAQGALAAAGGGSTSSLLSVPALNSLPGASASLYLDFKGDTTTTWGTYSPGTTPAFDLDGDPTTFSTGELTAIQQIWAGVAEKFSPFKINVTTVDTGNLTNLKTTKVVIGGTGAWLGGSFGGIAYVGGFYNTDPNTVFVFPANLGNSTSIIAEASSHESGHNFGLQHQSTWSGGTKTAEYNPGDGQHAPIMGNSYYAPRGQWWNGLNTNDVTQDDLATIASSTTNKFGYRADDRSNTTTGATALTVAGTNFSGSGIVEQTSDVDYYSLTTPATGVISFTGGISQYNPMLDLKLEIRNSANAVVASADTSSLGETVSATVPAGTYYVVAGSHANYADIGQYSLSGNFAASRVVSAPTGVTGVRGQTVAVPINIDNATGVQSFDLTLSYNTNLLDLSNADVSRGALLGPDWTVTANVDDVAGTITISGFSTTALSGGAGALVQLLFHVPADEAAGTSPIHITGRLNENNIPIAPVDGSIIIPLITSIVGLPGVSPEGTLLSVTTSDVLYAVGGVSDAWSVTKNGAAYASGSGTNFSFTPNDNGTYIVKVTVQDSVGNTGTDSQTVTVTNVSPTAAIAGAPASGPEGTAIPLTATVSDPGTLDTFSYAWSVTKDGAAYVTGTAAAFNFTPNDNGSYVVNLTVTDKDGGVATDSKSITINNVAPTAAIAGAPANSPEGTAINLTATVVEPGALDTLTYAWNVTKNGAAYASGTAATFGFTPDDNGTYVVNLSVTDKDGGVGTATAKTINVTNVTPAVAIVGAPTSGPEGTAINLTGTASDPGVLDTLTYAWGVTKNGTAYASGTGTSFGFTPDDNGTYVVTFSATDKDGAVGTATKTVTVTNVVPTATITGSPTSSPEGTTINLSGSATDPGVLDTITYAWNVTKNGSAFTSGAGANFSFTPNDNGTYVVTLTATDNNGGVGTASKTITGTNVAPVVTINGAPASSPEGTAISLTSAVIDPGTLDTFTYAWSVTKNGSAYASGTSASFSFTPNDNATYVVSLTVTDKDGGVGVAAAQTVTVTNVAPTVTINGAPGSSPEGTAINLTSTVSDPGALDTQTYAWNVTKDGVAFKSGAASTFSFTPDDNATYVVSLSVTDKDGAVGTASKTVSVTNVVPTVTITGAPTSSPEGTAINLTGSATDPGVLDTITYAWGVTKNGAAYGSGTGTAFGFTPDDNATYVVTLTATDKDGGVGTASKTVTVTNVVPTAAITGAPTSSPEGTAINLTGSATDPGVLDTISYAWSVTKNGGAFTSGTGTGFGFTPNDNGTYVVTLTTTDKDGGVGTASKTVTVTNVAPTGTIGAGVPASSPEGTAISMTGSASDPGALDTITYAWNVTKNGSAYTSGTGTSFGFTPNDNGSYVVTFTATDKDGGIGTDSRTVTATNVAPSVTINGAPASSPEGSAISLTSAVTDPGTLDVRTYAWSVTKDGIAYASGTSANFSFTPDDNASYVVSLTVTDKDGGAGTAGAQTVAVNNVAPTVAILGAPANSPEGAAINLTSTVSDPGTLDSQAYSWSVTKNGVGYASGTSANFGFTPDDNGTYVVTFSATDKDGGVGTTSKTIAVTNVVPAATISGAPASSLEGTAINLTGSAIDPGTLDTITYAWGVTKNGAAYGSDGAGVGFSFTPDDNGSYIVTLTTTDKDGGVGTASKTIAVTNVAPTATITGAPANSTEGAAISLTGSATDPGVLDTITFAWTVTKDGTAYTNGAGAGFSFTPDDNGSYVVTLTATDKDGGVGTASRTIAVTNVAPAATIGGAPATSPEGTAINLTGSATDPGVLDNVVFAWNVTKDGSAYGSGSGVNFSFTPNDDGSYVVTLTATDKDGGVGADSRTISVTNVAPSAAITGAPTSSPEGTAINLASAIVDPGTVDTFSYAWSVTKNGAAYGNGTGAGFGFTPDDNGTYVVTLTVTDKEGGIGTSAARTINVTNVAPVATISGAPNSSPEGVAINLSGAATDVGVLDTITLAWSVSKNGAAYASGAGSGFSFTPDGNGSYVVTLTATDKDGGIGTDSKTVDVSAVTFRVVSMTPTASGVDVTFNRPADPRSINLYRGLTTPSAAPDLTLVGDASGAVRGSMIWDASGLTVHFVKTGGALAAETYTLMLAARADGWIDTRGGMLDGNGDGAAGDNYVATFTQTASAARVLSLPAFVRGPGQAVNLPATDAGVPISIDDGAGLTSVSFDLVYDTHLLDVTGVSLAATLPADWTAALDTSVGGRARVTLSGATPLIGGPQTLARLIASVPTDAAYGSAEALSLSNASANGGAVTISSAIAVQVVAYIGDTTGNMTYSSLDAAQIARVVVGLDSGYDAFSAYDPRIIGDVTGDGTLSSLDASYIARKSIGLPQPEIPDMSGQGSALPAAPMTHVTVSIPPVSMRPGSTITVPVSIDSATGILSADVTLLFDPSLVNFSESDISLGGLTQGWAIVKNLSIAQGRLRISLFSTQPLAAGQGSILLLSIHVSQGAPVQADTTLGLSGQLNEGRISATTTTPVKVVIDGIAPQITSAAFDPFANSPSVAVHFSENVAGSLTKSALSISNLADGTTIDPSKFSLVYDAATNTGTFAFTRYAAGLPDGNYRATIAAGSALDAAGNPLASAVTFDFFALAGDSNHDRTVDFLDLAALAQNYNTSGRTFAQGDFNYDGVVDFLDLALLAQRYNTTLAAPAGAAATVTPAMAAPTSTVISAAPESSTVQSAVTTTTPDLAGVTSAPTVSSPVSPSTTKPAVAAMKPVVALKVAKSPVTAPTKAVTKAHPIAKPSAKVAAMPRPAVVNKASSSDLATAASPQVVQTPVAPTLKVAFSKRRIVSRLLD